MPNKSETGHAINVAHFNDLISFVKGYGSAYNPSNAALAISVLETQALNANNSISAVNEALAPYSTAVAAREVAFTPLSKLVTRVMNSLKASGVSQQVYDSVNTVARKIKGTRASAKVASATGIGESDTSTGIKQVSVSQMSYDSRQENFVKFIQLLIAVPQYAPNEVELQTATLTGLSTNLIVKNNDVINAEVPLSNARIARNALLYTETTGLCDIALTVKNYVKAVFGATSPQYKQISKIKFTKAI